MAYEFQPLGEVEKMEEVPENANAIVEVNGEIKRVPGSGLGGANIAIAEMVWTTSDVDTLAGDGSESQSISCTNMTYDEAKALINAGVILGALVSMTLDGESRCVSSFMMMSSNDWIAWDCNDVFIEWTADGIVARG